MVHLERPGLTAGDGAGLVVPSAPVSVGVARRFAVQAAVELGWGGVADTVALLVSEVATNAVLHADGRPIRVRVVDRGVRVRVEVDDDSPVLPVRRGAQAGSEDGRGLALVAALAHVWGVEAGHGGKTFWFEIGA